MTIMWFGYGESNETLAQRHQQQTPLSTATVKLDYKSQHEAAKKKCIAMETEVAKILSDVTKAREDEDWCKRAGDLTMKELKKLQVQVPGIETERDMINGECLHLKSELAELEGDLMKLMQERDSWKIQIEELKYETDRIQKEELEMKANLDQMKFFEYQTLNMLDQFMENNKSVQAQNEHDTNEIKHVSIETEAVKCSIMNIERERDNLAIMVKNKGKEVDETKNTVLALGKENDELNKSLDLLIEENPYLRRPKFLSLPNPLRRIQSVKSGLTPKTTASSVFSAPDAVTYRAGAIMDAIQSRRPGGLEGKVLNFPAKRRSQR